MEYIALFIFAAMVNNLVLVRMLGVCPFLGVSRNVESAFGMGLAIVFVTVAGVAICSMINRFVLMPLELEYLYLIVFILVIACLVKGLEIFVKAANTSIYASIGSFLPITTNCAIVAVVFVLNRAAGYSLLAGVVLALGASLGFLFVIVILAGIRERLDRCDIPKPFKGFPINMIAAGLMALAFLGFAGLV